MNLLSAKRQAIQGERMIKQYVEHVNDVKVGSYICVRVDKRDRRVNNNRGILGVVIEVTINKGIKVWTDKGILAFKGRVAISPPDTYKVLSDFATVPSKLQEMRAKILTGDIPTGPKVSKQEVHLAENGSWFHLKCACKTKCGPSCKCVKNNLFCSSGCGCRVNDFECGNKM
jgi:hypothetical protein